MKNLEDIYQLSPLQQGMLFHCLSRPESGLYWEQFSFILRGPLDPHLLHRAWGQVMQRHSALRTTIHWKGIDQPMQVVRKEVETPWAVKDWRADPEEHRRVRLDQLLEEDASLPLDFSRAPLMRLYLIQARPNLHYLIWSFHHLLLDGWSVATVLGEVFHIYQALEEGQTPRLAPPRPFRDYILWLQNQDQNQAQEFWTRTLAGFSEPTRIASQAGKEAGGRQALTSSECRSRWSAGDSSGLRSFAKKHRLTLNTLIQGAWALLLSRYSGDDDILFGATVSGRPSGLDGIEQMVGLFINTIPIRVAVGTEDRLAAWLARLQSAQIEARQFDYAALSEIQAWSQVSSAQPLFESLIVFENYPFSSPGDGGGSSRLEVQHLRTRERLNDPLVLAVEPERELLFKIAFDASRFERPMVEGMLDHLNRLLKAFQERPEGRVTRLPMFSPEDEEALLRRCSGPLPQRDEQSIHEMVEAQCSRTPDAIAVVSSDTQMTYAKLSRLSDVLAARLRQLGLGPDSPVALYLERSSLLLVGVLAVLKAGGCYLPLDPSYPPRRLAHMLEDSGASLLITQPSLADRCPDSQVPQLTLQEGWHQQPGASSFSLAGGDKELLAYITYTSGSTGRPKGVEVTHRSVANFLLSMLCQPGIEEEDILLAVTTLAFDISVLELLLPLLKGARLVVAGEAEATDAQLLARRMDLSGISMMQATPSHWRLLLESGWKGHNRLKILSGGEALPRDLATRLLDRCGQLWNLYGPTETTVWSAACRTQPFDEASAPIAQPVDHTQIYLLDRHLRPVPLGVPGELYIGGTGLARGYRNKPALTAERFIPDPFGACSGSRLYRTGDLARHRGDGSLAFLGRLDHQVKIRGFRIELEEIAQVLKSHPAVRESLVVTRPLGDDQDELRLVAYVVPRSSGSEGFPAQQVSGFLRQRLPDYMMPAAIVDMPAFPMTPNGKLDRHALPDPAGERPCHLSDFRPPENPLQEVLAEIWAEVLGQEAQVGIDDDFVELGGHSLLATRIVFRMQEILGVQPRPAQLFETPTIRSLEQELLASPQGAGLLKVAELLLSVEELSEDEAEEQLKQETLH